MTRRCLAWKGLVGLSVALWPHLFLYIDWWVVTNLNIEWWSTNMWSTTSITTCHVKQLYKRFSIYEKYKTYKIMQENTFICACNSYRKGSREFSFEWMSWNLSCRKFRQSLERGSFLFINYDSPPANALRCINEVFQARLVTSPCGTIKATIVDLYNELTVNRKLSIRDSLDWWQKGGVSGILCLWPSKEPF